MDALALQVAERSVLMPINVNIVHSSHLDLYWSGEQAECLKRGAGIIDDAVSRCLSDPKFHFMIETVRFVEYYLYHFPHRQGDLKKTVARGQIEIAACYTDRYETMHDGESLIRNVVYGKRMLRDLLGVESRFATHPDLPAQAPQIPQIYSMAGLDYYLYARLFHDGLRHRWQALDESHIITYNFPLHYGYYSFEDDLIPSIPAIQKATHTDDTILISCSAGDLGPCDAFIQPTKPGEQREYICLSGLIKDLNEKYPELHFQFANGCKTLDALDHSQLPVLTGETPSAKAPLLRRPMCCCISLTKTYRVISKKPRSIPASARCSACRL